MPDLSDYLDLRENSPDHKQLLCPECGTERWFKRDAMGDWRCSECNAEQTHDLQHTCRNCYCRMVGDGNEWVCQVCGRVDERDTDALIAVMSDNHERRRGYESVPWHDCPVCGGKHSIICDPDGARICEECDFYAGRFMDRWYALAEWRQDHDAVEVRADA